MPITPPIASRARSARAFLADLAPVGLAYVVLGMLWPAAGFAQVNATSDYLARMDNDGDGRVSQIEYLDWMSYAFDARDGNRDGVLTTDELPGGKGQVLTRNQHRERLAATFSRQDGNGDGYLSARELAAPPQ